MLVWPLPPRPLHACAKPRRKDLLDRVTEWVGKMRHREDSDDSLADPDTIAERATLVSVYFRLWHHPYAPIFSSFSLSC